jgi:outer membrane receptor protein involved in Fe transport
MRLLTAFIARSLAALILAMGTGVMLAAPASAQGGTGTIKGTVTQSGTDKPLAGVLVTVEGTTIKAVTGTRGTYTIDYAPTGAQTVIFRWLGYKPMQVRATVAASGVTTVDAKLEQQPIQLSELTVTGASKVPERSVEAPAAFSVVEPRVLQSTGITGQAALALREVPGVDLVQSGINDFNVNARGFNSSLNRRVLVLQDGRDLAVAFLGSQEWNALAVPADEFSKMELVRGPGSALYGANAFFGVLNITTPSAREVVGTKLTVGGGFQRPTRNDGSSLSGNTVRLDGRTAGTVGRFGYRLNAGYNRADSWSQARTSADGLDLKRQYGPVVGDSVKHPIPLSRELRPLNGQTFNPSTGATTGDPDPVENLYGSSRVDYYANDGSVITAEGGAAQIKNDIFVTGIGRVQVNKALRPYVRLGWANKGFNVMAYWNARRASLPTATDTAGRAQSALASGARLEEKSDILHVEAQDVHTFNDSKGRVVIGGSGRNYRVNTDSTLMRAADDKRSDYYYAVFSQVEYQLASTLRGVVAARVDIGSLISPQFSPKFALVYSPDERNSFRFTVNRAFQTPNYSEFFLRVPAGAPANLSALETGLRANPSLGPALAGVPVGQLFTNSSAVPVYARGNSKLGVESTLGLEAGYRGDLSPTVYLTLDGYVNRIRNFVTDLLPGVNPAFPYWTAPTAVPAAARAALADAVRSALIANPASATAGKGLTRTEDGNTAIVVSYTNAGKVTEYGLEAGAGAQLTRTLRTDGTLSLFGYAVSQKTVASGDSLLANTPSAKMTMSLSYADRGLTASAGVRAVKGYSWAAGVYAGYIEPNVQVNTDVAYDLNNNFKVFLSATNLFNNKKFEIYGGSVNGRRILGGITTRF